MRITPVPEDNPEVHQQLTNLAEFIKHLHSELTNYIGVPANHNIPKMKKLKFKEVKEPIPVMNDILYEITDGSIRPEKLMEPEDAAAVYAAAKLLQDFLEQGEDAGVLEVH
jgi:hypothetical protein